VLIDYTFLPLISVKAIRELKNRRN